MKKHDLIGKLLLSDIEKTIGKRRKEKYPPEIRPTSKEIVSELEVVKLLIYIVLEVVSIDLIIKSPNAF